MNESEINKAVNEEFNRMSHDLDISAILSALGFIVVCYLILFVSYKLVYMFPIALLPLYVLYPVIRDLRLDRIKKLKNPLYKIWGE